MSAGHDIEDVDLDGLTPWEESTVRMALVTLRRHGFNVTITLPANGQPAPVAILDNEHLAIPASARTYAKALQLRPVRDALQRAMLEDGIIESRGDAFDVVGPLEPAEAPDAPHLSGVSDCYPHDDVPFPQRAAIETRGYDEALDCPCPMHAAARAGAL